MIFEKAWREINSIELADRLDYALAKIRDYKRINKTPGYYEDRMLLSKYNENKSEFMKTYMKRYSSSSRRIMIFGIIIACYLAWPTIGTMLYTVFLLIKYMIEGGFIDEISYFLSFPITFIVCFAIELLVIKYMIIGENEKIERIKRIAEEDAKREIDEIKMRVETINKKQAELIDIKFMDIIKHINEDYRYEDAIAAFVDYLRKGRVSTLPEAYVLYNIEREKDKLTELHNYSQKSDVFDMVGYIEDE